MTALGLGEVHVWRQRLSRLGRAGWLFLITGLVILGVTLPLRALRADETDFNRLVGWSNILACSIAAIGFVLLVKDRRKALANPSAEDLDKAADQLAGEVLKQESVQRARMLGTDTVNFTTADVQFDRVDRLVNFEEVEPPTECSVQVG